MADLAIHARAPVSAPPPAADTEQGSVGDANKGILFTQATLPPELQKLKAAIIELRKPSANVATEDDINSGNVGGPSDEDLNMLLGEIDEMVTSLRYATGKNKIGLQDDQRRELAKKVAKALDEANQKLKEAQEAASESTTMGWLMAGLAMAGAVLLCVVTVAAAAATGGAVGGLAIFGCVAAVTLAVQMITDMSLKEAGVTYTACTGEEKQFGIGFDKMVEAIVDREIVNGDIVIVRQNDKGEFLDKDGNVTNVDPRKGAKSTAIFFTPEELSEWKMGWTVTTTLVVAIALGAVGGFASTGTQAAASGARAADGAAKGANAAKSAASAARWASVERGAEVLAVGTAVATGVTAITKGIIDIFIAELNSDSEKARADKAFYEVQAQDVSRAWDLSMDSLRQLVEHYLENGQARSKNVADRGRTAAAFTRPIMG
ncbi:hypothetical protein GHT07_07330 [Caenimonas koreensis DSM 17982]|uniref:Uncharacterized protein n=1 Tax=Caenimonas koreensis DSM 17982 TaxID=1121255 RepID=A0A844AS21_9BURK|nr:hypothetical protein [Caenimonas koreensis]MRD47085.1 hypothetical protein [Caenimonas koreensis DSM 17982]